MNLILLLCSRFLKSRKQEQDAVLFTKSKNKLGFVSFISSISVAGVALGVSALLVVTSVINGFENELKKTLTGFHSHILFYSKAEPISNPEILEKELKEKYATIEVISPYIFVEGMLSSTAAGQSSGSVSGVVLEGVEVKTAVQATLISKKVIEGSLPESDEDIALGVEVAKKLKVKLGDRVLLTIPFAQKDQQHLVKPFKICGFVKLGTYEYDSKYVVASLKGMQDFLGFKNQVNAFKIKTKNANTSAQLSQQLNDTFVYPMRARDWSSFNRNLLYAIQLEKAVITIILMGISLVAGFNVIGTILMVVQDKKKQVSILKAMGFSAKSAFALFFLVGLVISTSGAFAGVLLAGLLCSFIRWKSIIDLPAEVYMFSSLQVDVRPFEWFVICLLVIVLALVCAWIPSRSMARENAVTGLKHE